MNENESGTKKAEALSPVRWGKQTGVAVAAAVVVVVKSASAEPAPPPIVFEGCIAQPLGWSTHWATSYEQCVNFLSFFVLDSLWNVSE